MPKEITIDKNEMDWLQYNRKTRMKKSEEFNDSLVRFIAGINNVKNVLILPTNGMYKATEKDYRNIAEALKKLDSRGKNIEILTGKKDLTIARENVEKQTLKKTLVTIHKSDKNITAFVDGSEGDKSYLMQNIINTLESIPQDFMLEGELTIRKGSNPRLVIKDILFYGQEY